MGGGGAPHCWCWPGRRACRRGSAAVARLVERHVLPVVESGQIKVPIARTFPLAEAAAAYAYFATPGKLGKVVLTT